jgi:protoporphyrin/coproporphyrin ferrochelatase
MPFRRRVTPCGSSGAGFQVVGSTPLSKRGRGMRKDRLVTDRPIPHLLEQPNQRLDPYDAILLVSFGGPEGPDDVLPFLENVTRGRGIPKERLAEVGEHYYLFGGRSPINDQCRSLLAALRMELDRRLIATPLYWGNRNWTPYLRDALKEIVAAGHRRVLAVFTSAYPSYSSCRQYRENLYDAADRLPVQIDRIRHYATHPGFVAASVAATLTALDQLGPGSNGAQLLFVTHSIPVAMATTAGPEPRSSQGAYVDWHAAVAAEVTRQVSARRGTAYEHELVYCSRSGPPQQPWLEPDVNDRLAELKATGTTEVVLVPIGFISDHMEVIFDLDTEAAHTAANLGLGFARAATAGTDPAFVFALADLIVERAAVARGEATTPAVIPGGELGWYACAGGCCPNRTDPDRPTLCSAVPAELS